MQLGGRRVTCPVAWGRAYGAVVSTCMLTCPVAGIEPRLGVATCQPVHAVRGGDLSTLRRAPSSWLNLTSDLAWLGLACAARSMGALEVALAFPGPFSNRFMDRLGSYTAGYNRLRTFVCSLSSVTRYRRARNGINYNPISVYRRCMNMYRVHWTSPRWSRWETRIEWEKRAVAGNHPSSPAVEQRNSTSGVPPGAS